MNKIKEAEKIIKKLLEIIFNEKNLKVDIEAIDKVEENKTGSFSVAISGLEGLKKSECIFMIKNKSLIKTIVVTLKSNDLLLGKLSFYVE